MRRRGKIHPWVGLALVASLVLLGKRHSMTSSPNPNIIPAVRTGPNSREEWMRSRLEALQGAGVTGDVALAILAHWAHETGFGVGEFNYNLGNLGAFSPAQLQHPLPQAGGPDAGNPTHFQAYRSLSEGVAAYLKLLRGSLYHVCESILTADPSTDAWIRCLGAHGYYSPPKGVSMAVHTERYAGAYMRALSEVRGWASAGTETGNA